MAKRVADPAVGVQPADAPAEEAVREQVSRLLASPDFLLPDRARRFLVYIIEETLCGRADHIKALSIATDVLGRDSSFDSTHDPVVRIEAGRVRRALERYYLTGGVNDPIVITIPKGGYVPAFFLRPGFSVDGKEIIEPEPKPLPGSFANSRRALVVLLPAALILIGLIATLTYRHVEISSEAAAVPAIPRLSVVPFSGQATPGTSELAKGLTDEVIRHLARFKEIRVISEVPSAISDLKRSAQYELRGAVRLTGKTYRLSAQLIDLSGGSVIWAENYDGDLGVTKVLDDQAAMTVKVATAVAQPYGVIFHTDAAKLVRDTHHEWGYGCTLAYYAYRADLNPRSHRSVERCLERTTERFPTYATAWALLSLTYLDDVRFRHEVGSKSKSPLDKAFDAAWRAVNLDPGNARSLQAYMTALFFQGNVQAALKVAKRAVSINPNDTELKAEYALRLALSGQWDRGRDLMLDVLDRNPGPLDYYESVVALCFYMVGDYTTAGAYIGKARPTANPIYHVIAAAIYGQLGREKEAKGERDWFAASAPDFLKDDLPKAIRISGIGADDQQRLLEGLAKAGISPSS